LQPAENADTFLKENYLIVASYKDIAKSSGLIAFVQVAQMFFALLRNKAISLLLGSGAFGLYSLYNTFIEMGSVLAIFGINNSVVREISRCGDDKRSIGKVYYISNRLILISSIIVFLLIFVFAEDIGYYMFNENGHTAGIRCVAFIILFMVVAYEGYAILNGIRSLRNLAVSQIVSSGVGSIGVVFAILLWQEDAIPAALGIVSVTMAVVTYIYVRKNGIREEKVSWREFKKTSHTLLCIGAGVTVAGIVSTVMSLMSKSFLTENYSISAVGFYQSSWTISNLYTGIILTAMGVDFMPRISRVIDDGRKATELINQQTIFGVVMCSVAISGILLFSKEILYILYAEEFEVASAIVRWHIIGVFLRVMAFPLSYTILAKGEAKLYAVIQILFWTGDYVLLMICSYLWGFDGLGVNYPIAYFCYLSMAFFAVRRICRFKYSNELVRVLLILCAFIAMAWFVSLAEIGRPCFRYGVAGMLLISHFCFVYVYLKNKMDLNIWQLIKSRIVRK